MELRGAFKQTSITNITVTEDDVKTELDEVPRTGQQHKYTQDAQIAGAKSATVTISDP